MSLRARFKGGARLAVASTFISSLITFFVASPAYAISTLQIGNSPTQAGTYLNAQDIADNLVFTSIFVQATTSIEVVDPIDLSTSTFGAPNFNLTLSAPVCTIDANINIGAQGHLFLSCNTLNLNGKITSGGSLIDSSRVTGTAMAANVLSNDASIQQAIDFSSKTSTPTVFVKPGLYTENFTIDRPLVVAGDQGSSQLGAGPNAPTIRGTQPGGNVITVTGNSAGIEGLHLNGVVGDGTPAASVDGIYANGVDSLAAVHNTLDGFTGPGIDTLGSTNTILQLNNIIPPSPANQTVAFTSTAPTNAAVGGSVYTPTASATSGLTPVITVDATASNVCSINGGVVSFQSAGTCVLNANQAGNANYNAAPQVQQSFAVSSPALTWSGFQQPINADGSSIFKLGRTVPVKFQLTGASAGITNLQARLYVTKIDNNIEGSDVEAISTAAADSGNMFRYDPTSKQYVFNLGTTSLTAGAYRLKIYVNGDSTTGTLLGTVTISIK